MKEHASIKFKRVDKLPENDKIKLVKALKNNNTYIIEDMAKILNIRYKTLLDHIIRWAYINEALNDCIDFTNDLPKDLSFTERLNLALDIAQLKF